MASPEVAGWTATRAFGRTILLCGVLLLAAVFTRRIDLVVLAAPIAFGAALSLWRMPQSAPVVSLDLAHDTVGEGDGIRARLEVGNHDLVRYDLVVVRVRVDEWLRLEGADRPYAASIAPRSEVTVDLDGHVLRWGRWRVGPAVAHAVAAGALWSARCPWERRSR